MTQEEEVQFSIEYLEELQFIYQFVNIDEKQKKHKKKLSKIIEGLKNNDPKYLRGEYDEDDI